MSALSRLPAVSAASHPSFVRSLWYMRELPTERAIVPRNELAVYGVGYWLSKHRDLTIDQRKRRHAFQRAWHGKSIYDGAIYRGCAARVARHHCDARGDGRTDGADCRRGGQGAAPRATQRGNGAARGRRADHGDRVNQDPASHFLRRRELDPSR